MSNYTIANRTDFGAGREVRVIVNNPNRERHGKVGIVTNNTHYSKFAESRVMAWVFWDDGHYPSSEDLTNLAPAPTN